MICYSCKIEIQHPKYIYAYFSSDQPICSDCDDFLTQLTQPIHNKCNSCHGTFSITLLDGSKTPCLGVTHLSGDYLYLCCIPGCGYFMDYFDQNSIRVFCSKHSIKDCESII